MDRNYIDDHHIVARYLADQLSDAEREAFEAYYLEHPEIVQELEAATRFKVGLAHLKESGELDVLLKPKAEHPKQRFLALAAGLAVVAIGAFLFIARAPSSQPTLVASATQLIDRFGKSLPATDPYTILRTRSASYDAEIVLPKSPQTIALRVLPEVAAQPARYRITLSAVADDDSTREIATVGGLASQSDGFVAVYVNSSKLQRGRYLLVISGDAGTSAEREESPFFIRVVDDVS